MDLQGCVAIVTGGAGGIGAALCKSLLSRGVKVSCRNLLWYVIKCSWNNYCFNIVSPAELIICILFF